MHPPGSLIVSGENREVLNAAELYEYDYWITTPPALQRDLWRRKANRSAIYKLTAAESHAYYTTNHGEQALTSR